jgi:hypothetical protein
MQWQTIHYMIWGLQELIFYIIINNKRTASNLQCNAKDTTCFGWRIVVEQKKNAQDAFPLIFNAF